MPQVLPQKPKQRPKAQGGAGLAIPLGKWTLRLPFATAGAFFQWFVQGINYWAVGGVLLAALAGWSLLCWLQAPRVHGLEQALEGGSLTAGLDYTVTYGQGGLTLTGVWKEKKGQSAPTPEAVAALCAALSPESIYGHSEHLYQEIENRYFQGKPFDITILFREAKSKEPFFTLLRPKEATSWPAPTCADSAFVAEYLNRYDGYWMLGKGRPEELGPAQSSPLWDGGEDWTPPPAATDSQPEASASQGSSVSGGDGFDFVEAQSEESTSQRVESSSSTPSGESAAPAPEVPKPQNLFEWFLRLVSPWRRSPALVGAESISPPLLSQTGDPPRGLGKTAAQYGIFLGMDVAPP